MGNSQVGKATVFGIVMRRFEPYFPSHQFSRDVAQPGSAFVWGAKGRRFEAGHPDQSQNASEGGGATGAQVSNPGKASRFDVARAKPGLQHPGRLSSLHRYSRKINRLRGDLATIAQSVERRIEDPRVGGSTPSRGTKSLVRGYRATGAGAGR